MTLIESGQLASGEVETFLDQDGHSQASGKIKQETLVEAKSFIIPPDIRVPGSKIEVAQKWRDRGHEGKKAFDQHKPSKLIDHNRVGIVGDKIDQARAPQ